MKIAKRFIISVLLMFTIAFLSCAPDWEVKTDSYVITYAKTDGINFREVATYNAVNFVVMSVSSRNGQEIASVDSSKASEQTLFKSLCTRYGDMGYNRKISGYMHETKHLYYADEFTAISIVSDKDYDDLHPAGTPLNDLLRFVAVTPLPYIKSGYTEEYDWDSMQSITNLYKQFKINFYNDRFTSTLHPIDKPLNQVTADDLKLLGFGDSLLNDFFYILMPHYPTVKGTHTFTIKLTDAQGKTHTDTLLIGF